MVPPTLDVQFDEHGHQVPGTGRVDPDAFAQAMVDAANTLMTVGGSLNIAPARQAIPGPLKGVYQTHAVVFTWESFVPALEPSPEQAQANGAADEPVVDAPSTAEPQPAEA